MIYPIHLFKVCYTLYTVLFCTVSFNFFNSIYTYIFLFLIALSLQIIYSLFLFLFIVVFCFLFLFSYYLYQNIYLSFHLPYLILRNLFPLPRGREKKKITSIRLFFFYYLFFFHQCHHLE